jgi:hypothetical protein
MAVSEKKLAGAVYGGRVSLCIEALSVSFEPIDALVWLTMHNQQLGGCTPAQLLRTEEGFKRVAVLIDTPPAT